MEELNITTKNGKKYNATSTDGKFWRVNSEDRKQTKSCGSIVTRNGFSGTHNSVNGGNTVYDIAEYLSTRGF